MQPWIERRSHQQGYSGKQFNAPLEDGDFQRDRARVIHSAAFRCLQSKTQVLGIGENDFYRTRLTHSLEVAQIGSGICARLRERYQAQPDRLQWLPSQNLIEAICLSHDLGHPPFGHGGEVALNYMMFDHGGFEGNGQTLRILSTLGEYSEQHGLDLTRRTMLGVLKYPAGFSQLNTQRPPDYAISKHNIDPWKPPKCVMDDELPVVEWMLAPLDAQDKALFRSVAPAAAGHHKTRYKGFDTSIMEIADDIAYGVHDLEDALALQLVSFKQWQQEVVAPLQQLPGNPILERLEFYNDKLFSENNKGRKHAISRLVNYFISEIEIVEDTRFQHPLLRLKATLPAPAQEILEILKRFIFNFVIKRPEVQALEYKGQQMILRLFEVLQDNSTRLLPAIVKQDYLDSATPQRVICDYLAGMTDSYANKLYHKLFSPDTGSVFDRL